MRPSAFLPKTLFCLGFLAFLAASAQGAANHVVISEFATRGPSTATDEFIELYNPTESAIDISGWRLQYKPAAGSSFSDRAILPANSSIAPHGFFLIANNTYTTGAAPDYTSALWGSGQGMADNGHMRILNASLVEVDRVGWGGTADSPEGGSPAPNHGTTANGNSVERKALANSTADSLRSGGRHALLGNGQDTNVNGADYVAQSFGRNPQNSGSPPEPAFASGGNGSGRARMVQPTVIFTSRSVDSLKIAFAQDSAYTVTTVKIVIAPGWAWPQNASAVVLSGAAFASASVSVTPDSVLVTGATLTSSDSGTVTIATMTSPATKGQSTFNVLTAVSGGAPAPILVQPKVRVLELVPIVVVHVNDASGVPTSPYGIGAEATVTGTVTVNYSTTRTDIYLQDGTAGINLFSFTPPPFTINAGDSLTVTGSILQFRGLTELQPDYALVTVHTTGRPVPEPLVMNCAGVNATFQPDYTEPNESRLIRINGVTYNSVNSTITDASGTTNVFIPSSYPPTPSVFDIIGILKQFKPGTPAPGPPYTSDYEITPRTPDDIISHAGPIITTTPFEDQIQATSVRINWTTNVASSSIVRYGTTVALGDSVVVPTPVTSHAVTLPGLTPATVYHYSVGSGDGNGTNFSPSDVFSTASPPQSTGVVNVYFNKSVDHSLAFPGNPANGNADLVARLVSRIDAARRSIDAALYSMSGTTGATVASRLVAAKNRGVKVRVINEYDNSGTAPFGTLASAGIPLINDRFDPINNGLGLMHNKFFVFDARGGAPESTWVWTGSWNLTDPGTNDDYQNAIEIQDQSVARVFTLEFQEMWGSTTDTPNASVSRFGARKLDDTPHKFVVGSHAKGDILTASGLEVYFSPSDNATGQIIARINAAQRTIGFQLLTLTRSDIANALIARHVGGIDVRGDLDNGTDSGSEYANLVSNGVDVRLNNGGGFLHHKYAIFDFDVAPDPWLGASGWTLTGSHNWSSAAENNNSENTIVYNSPSVTNQYLQEFGARYYQFGGSDSIRIVGVDPIGGVIPPTLSMAQNFPNPVRGRTSITYALPRKEHVRLRLYDVGGREVRTLVDQLQIPGSYRVDADLRSLPSGMYFYRLEAGGMTRERKMLRIR